MTIFYRRQVLPGKQQQKKYTIMKKHDTIDEVMLLEAHEASELLDKGSYYFEQDGKIGRIETFASGAKELHNTDLVILGYYYKGCTGYPCVTKELYQQLTNETV